MAKKKIAKSKPSSKQPLFEESLVELESIVAKLEGGQLGLADSLEEYEQGVKHLKSCYQQLSAAEQRIELVSQVDASGQPKTEAFDGESSASLDEKGEARSRRSHSPGPDTRTRSIPQGSIPQTKRRSSSEVDDVSSLF